MRTRIALPLPTTLSCRAAGYAAPLAALAATVVLPLSALAAENSGRTLEEVIVTAQRREQSLQDVPVAVSVVSAETIRDLSLQNLDQLSNYVPGFNVREGGEQTSISLRGFATGLNFGFDQSVGLFIDGIYAGRERQFRSTFLDIGSVEVLKGPQATLFGKNTTAGAAFLLAGRAPRRLRTSARKRASAATAPTIPTFRSARSIRRPSSGRPPTSRRTTSRSARNTNSPRIPSWSRSAAIRATTPRISATSTGARPTSCTSRSRRSSINTARSCSGCRKSASASSISPACTPSGTTSSSIVEPTSTSGCSCCRSACSRPMR